METHYKANRLFSERDPEQPTSGQSLGDDLMDRWLVYNDDTDRGLWPLKNWLNKRLLKRVYTDYGLTAPDPSVICDYDALSVDYLDLALFDRFTNYGQEH